MQHKTHPELLVVSTQTHWLPQTALLVVYNWVKVRVWVTLQLAVGRSVGQSVSQSWL